MKDQKQQWRQLAKGFDAETLTADDVRNMNAVTFAVLALAAARGAAKGRALAKDPIGPHWTEDEDTALDAVQRVYSETIQGREHRSIIGRAYWAGRTMGKRRAKDRIRERASAIVPEPTDRKLPAEEAKATWAELLARCSPAKREALNQAAARWLSGEDKNNNAVRDMRRAIGVRSPAGAPALA